MALSHQQAAATQRRRSGLPCSLLAACNRCPFLFKRILLLGLQVPQECPQAVSDMVFACLKRDPSCRPTAQQIIHVIENSMADNQAGE